MTDARAADLIVDTSAAVAIMSAEPGSDDLIGYLAHAKSRRMSAATRLELGLVIETRYGSDGSQLVARFLRDADIEIVDVDAAVVERGLTGWRRYGKGRHPAGLNFGDSFTYGLAEQTGCPVLCTGDDFAATDVPVLRPGHSERHRAST